LLGSGLQVAKYALVGLNPVVRNVLAFQTPVDRHENIEVPLGILQKRSILAAAPAGLADRLNSVAAKSVFDSGVNAFV